MDKSIIYFGYNNIFDHKRGVENVIEFQSLSSQNKKNYYIHWDSKNIIYHHKNLICIGIKKNYCWIYTLNIYLFKIKQKKAKFKIHSHNPLMSFFSLLKTNIFTVHDSLYFLNFSKKHKYLQIFKHIERLVYKKTDIVHFISHYTKKNSLYSKKNNNYVIIHNSSHFENHKVDKEEVKNNYTRNILVVRGIEERSRIDLIVELSNYLRNENYSIKVAGKGPLLDFFKNKILDQSLNNISFLGYITDDDLLKLYIECDFVLMTAEYGEGFGLPIIEGYLFNKPVIASNKCAIPEIIFSSDFLFENTVESIVEKINFVFENNNHDFNKYYLNRFSNSVISSEYRKLYKSIFQC